MPFYKHHLKNGFLLPVCEKHFHDSDETWLILKGKGTGYWIDREGKREDFLLDEGDAWMIPVGYEHGSDGPNSNDFTISVFYGECPAGSRSGHLYMEKEEYIPTFSLVKTKIERYK